MSTEIHLVMAGWHYEGAIPLKAFKDRAKAESFSDTLEKYQAKKPEPPGTIEDTPENNGKWESYTERDKVWRDAHPGGSSAGSADYFEIANVPFED